MTLDPHLHVLRMRPPYARPQVYVNLGEDHTGEIHTLSLLCL